MVGTSLVVALSELAARVQRGRTTDQVLEIAGDGARQLGLRLLAFQAVDDWLVLRYLATAKERYEALERLAGRPLRGLRAPLARCEPVGSVIAAGRHVYRSDLDVFVRFVHEATGHDPAPLDSSPDTAGVSNGVLAPLFVGDRPWGLLIVTSPDLRPDDAAGVALFALHLCSAIEATEFIEALVEREQLAALGEVATVVAHEVRNPLGTIYNAVALLHRFLREQRDARADTAKAERLVDIVGEEANNLKALVADLLDLGRGGRLDLQRMSLGDVAGEVVSAAARRPEAARIDLRVEAPKDLEQVDLDPRLVRQALTNLVVNAMQAMPAGGTLTVRADIERQAPGCGCWACLRVSDTDHAIAPALRERLAQPFLGPSPDRTGLGLAIVKRVIESHGGEILLDTSGARTTLSLRLPVQANQG